MQPSLSFIVKFPEDTELFRTFIENIAETLVQANMEYFAKYGYPEEIEIEYEDPKIVSMGQVIDTAPFIERRGKATCITYCAYMCAIWRMQKKNCRVIAVKQGSNSYHTLIEITDEDGNVFATDATKLIEEGQEPGFNSLSAERAYHQALVDAGHYCCSDCARQELNHACSTCAVTGCCL